MPARHVKKPPQRIRRSKIDLVRANDKLMNDYLLLVEQSKVSRDTHARRDEQLRVLLDEKTQLTRQLNERPTFEQFCALETAKNILVAQRDELQIQKNKLFAELRWIARHAIAGAVGAKHTFDSSGVTTPEMVLGSVTNHDGSRPWVEVP